MKAKEFKYKSIAVGGTFDHIHKGHKMLLSRAFDSGEVVHVGLTSDDFVRRAGKKIAHNYSQRMNQLRKYLNTEFPSRIYKISKLEEDFGPAVIRGEIEAIVVSEETKAKVEDANEKRVELGYSKLESEIVPMVLAWDGGRISSSRVRAGEIELDGERP